VPLVAALTVAADLRTLIIATLLVYSAAAAGQFALCVRAVPIAAKPAFGQDLFRELIAYGGWMSVVSLLGPLTMLADRLAIGSRIGSAAVSLYVIPYNLVSRVVALPASLSSASLPKIAASEAEQEQTVKSAGLRLLLATLTPMCIAGIGIMGPFLHYWVGSTVSAQAATVGCILAFGYWMHGIGHIPSTVLLGRGRPDMLAKLYLIYLLPYFILLFFLLDRFGIAGAAIAWAVRASGDLSLFAFSGLKRAEGGQVATGALLVLGASAAGIFLDWHRLPYWFVLAPLFALSLLLAWAIAPDTLRSRFVSIFERTQRS